MTPVENVPLVQSSLNDRILLDLHLGWRWMSWTANPLAITKRFGSNILLHRIVHSKVIHKTRRCLPEPSRLADGPSTPLMDSSTVDEKGDTKTNAVTRKQALDDASDDLLLEAGPPLASSEQLVFRSSQLEQRNIRYQELGQFKEENDHCSVPLRYPNNSSLAHWMKRQRHQYRMKKKNKHSTLTGQRQEKLEYLRFIWDSHATAWNQLSQFRDEHGHSRVPKKYPPNQPLVSLYIVNSREPFPA
jgi:hypothetical protein